MIGRILLVLFLPIILILVGLQIHNVIAFSPFGGLDAAGHIEYIELLKKEWRVPLANEGWELYQPPVYYFLAHLLPTLKAVQVLGFLMWVVLATAIFLVSRSLLATVWVLSLPVVITTTPAVSNEFFSGVIITLAMVYYLLVFKKKQNRWVKVGMGLLLGLALLSKATAFVLVGAIFFDQVIKKRVPWLVFLIAFLLAGWFYLRNMAIFGNPFISSIDFPQYKIDQPPGYRDIKFFTDLSGFYKFNLFRAHWDSLIPGTYFTFFYDGHNLMVPVQEFSKAGAALVLMSYGFFGLVLVGIKRSLLFPTGRFLGLYSGLLLLGYVAYNLKYPFYSTVKGAFLISLVLPLGYFLGQGVTKLSGKWRAAVTGYFLLYIAILVRHFWV